MTQPKYGMQTYPFFHSFSIKYTYFIIFTHPNSNCRHITLIWNNFFAFFLMNVCCRTRKQLPPVSGFYRCVAEHCGKARCAETRFPPGAGCQKPDRARQGRGQHYHPHHPAWDLQAMKLRFFQTGASWNTPVWLFSPTIDEFSYGNETPSLLYNAAKKKKKIFSSLCHILPGHTMHVGSIFPVAVAGGEKKPSEALHQPHLLHNQFMFM